MNSKIKILVLGNCTSYSISEGLRESGLFASVASAVVFSMTTVERESLAASIGEFDFILSLEHAAWAGPLATEALRAQLGERLITLPTPFFSGLHPEKAYLKYGGEISRSQAVMGDYHSALILEEVKSGFDTDKIISRYISGEAFARLNVINIWNESIVELKQREKNNDIVLSDFIEMSVEDGSIERQFLTFNHPAEGLISHIVRQVIQRITGKYIDSPFITADRHCLYGGPRWPLHPYVAAELGLPTPRETRFKRSEKNGGEWIEAAEFVCLSIDFFLNGKNPKEFKIVTPHYLLQNILPC